MAKFDVEGARAAGYTDAEIANYLANQSGFNAIAAREAGYTDAEIVAHLAGIAPKPKKQEPDRSAAQYAGVITNALAPYATAAGLGAAAAGIPSLGIGAPLGAATGVLSLGVGDLGTGIYNLAAPAFGGERVPLPSETIRRGYESIGIGRRPQTPEQEVLFRTAEGAASALGGASAFNALARTAPQGVTRNVMQELGRAPGVQTAAGAGAGAAPAIASEYAGVENPLALFGLSMAGGMAAGRAATPRGTPIPSEQFAKQAEMAYERARAAGVQFDPAAISQLSQGIRSALSTPDLQFHPGLHPRIKVVLEDIDNAAAEAQKRGTPISFSELELLRRVARTAGKSMDADERRLASGIIRQIDDFVDAPPPNAILAGQGDEAASAVKEARTAWRRMSQSDNINNMIIEKATDTAEGLSANTIRAAARSINKSESKKRAFDPAVQKQIKDLGRGSGGLSTLQTLGLFGPRMPTTAPEMVRAIPAAGVMTGTGAAAYSGSPVLTLLGLTTAGAGMASNAAANRLALGRVNRMIDTAQGVNRPKPPTLGIAAQSAMQAPRTEALDDEYEYYYDENGELRGLRLKNPSAPVAPAR
jgi:hypothetical protein